MCNGGERSAALMRYRPLLAIALCWLASAVSADDLADGLRLSSEGRCPEALALLDASAAPAAARARGLCLLRTADPVGAVRELAPLEANDPGLTVDLAVARFHSGERALAEESLLRAEARGELRPEIPLYLGLIALDRSEASLAAGRFERARELAPLQVEPAASYYAGLARGRAGERAAARAALERVVTGWPGSLWAAEAQRALAAGDAAPRALFASLRAGFEHDTNAVLLGEGITLPAEIPSQSDQRLVWRGVIGRAASVSDTAQLGGALAFSGSLQRELGRFDTLHPSLTLWADRRLGERISMRAIGSYSHAWVDERAFLSAPAFTLELSHDAAEFGATRVFAEFVFDDYRFERSEPDAALRRQRDRDGFGLRVGLDHRVVVQALDTTLVAALAYRHFNADGSEYAFDSPEFELGWESLLPAKFVFAGSARYAFRPYRHDSSYAPFGERTEHEWRTQLSLRRALLRQLALETRWRYQRNRSSVDVFEFTRHVVGLYATWTLNP